MSKAIGEAELRRRRAEFSPPLSGKSRAEMDRTPSAEVLIENKIESTFLQETGVQF